MKSVLLEEIFGAGKSGLDLDNHWMMEFLWSPAGEGNITQIQILIWFYIQLNDL